MQTRALALIALPLLAAACSQRVQTVIDGDPVIRVLRKDAIRAIDRPKMIPAAEANGRIVGWEPVLGVFDGTTARAYPLWYLDDHEIVNDVMGDTPIAATW